MREIIELKMGEKGMSTSAVETMMAPFKQSKNVKSD